MAKNATFHCSVITPEKAVLECDAKFAAFPAHDGEAGVMVNRAPLLYRLGVGKMRVETDSETHTMVIDGGFAQVFENKLTILTEQAKNSDEIDLASSEQALIEARAMTITDDESWTSRDRAIRRAQIQIKQAK